MNTEVPCTRRRAGDFYLYQMMTEEELIRRAISGDKISLEELVKQHQNWIFNTALIFVGNREVALDITQEVLIKMVTKLSTFDLKSQFRTWLYRIIKNHFLNMKRSKYEQGSTSFEAFGQGLDNIPDDDPKPGGNHVELDLIINEAKISCMNGMLLCLNREQRLIFIIGELFEFPDIVGAEVMDISRENFRVKLHRAKKQLYTFMEGKCGLIKKSNPCRCARKTAGFIKLGYVDPDTLQFQHQVISDIKSQLGEKMDVLEDDVHVEYRKLFQDNPFLESPDSIDSLKKLLESDPVKEAFNL